MSSTDDTRGGASLSSDWNRDESLSEVIAGWAESTPDRPAIIDDHGVLTWAGYDAASTALSERLRALGLPACERVAVLLPDGRDVHIAFVAIEKAGCVAVGIGPRAGRAEIEHLLSVTGARALVSRAEHRDMEMGALVGALREAGLALRHHVVVDPEEASSPSAAAGGEAEGGAHRIGPDDLFLLNSTSGTTGLPKCVRHTQRRWFFFHELAQRTGRLCADDVFMSVVPAPFGFGIWTSHVTPALLGAPTVLCEAFDAETVLESIERHRVSVLAAVSTQFIMLLNSPRCAEADWSSLRVLYTGGEAVPYARAAEFEERSGASVLQFYGSNETGALCGTALDDTREKRLRTAGRLIPEMQVRLFDPEGRDVTETGRGEPGCKGPALSQGYYEDATANRALIREDGWVMVNDLVTVDAEGYLTVVGRTGDFIIRGGKNISGPAVEEAVAQHPAVALAAAVAMPDPVFGERVCAYVELREGASLELEALVAEMQERGVSKENLPERLIVLDALPRGSGGKVAKGQLREDIRRRLAGESPSAYASGAS